MKLPIRSRARLEKECGSGTHGNRSLITVVSLCVHNAILQLPDIQQKQLAAGSISTGGTPEQFHEILKSELAKLGKLIKEAEIKADAGG